MDKMKENFINKDHSEEINYYDIVRSTLHGLDGIRLNAVVSGITLCVALLGAAIAAANTEINIKKIVGVCFDVNPHLIGFILSSFLSFISLLVSDQFLKKINMFNYFIDQSVRISLRIEEKIIQAKNLRLTESFNAHTYGGRKGDQLFLLALNIMWFFSYLLMILSISLVIHFILP
jgi:hypothetical protein